MREEDKIGTTEKLEGKDKKKETEDWLADQSCASLCKVSGEKVDNADQLVLPPWYNSDSGGSEVLRDVFQRFGSVKVTCKLCPTSEMP